MRVVARFFVIVLCAAALVTLAGAGGGCGGGSGGPGSQWERVTTAQVSGDKPVRLHLGNPYPGPDRCRPAYPPRWVLSGPDRLTAGDASPWSGSIDRQGPAVAERRRYARRAL